MTKLEELKAACAAAWVAYVVACDAAYAAWSDADWVADRAAYDAAWVAYVVACDAAYAARDAAYVAWDAAYEAYRDELKKTQEENSDD